MKVSKKWLFLLLFVFVVIILTPYFFSYLNTYQTDGTINIPELTKPVKVLRDEKGMAYIYAQNFNDLWFAQGFIAAQDRLFPMELTRLFATGRICELAGEKAKPLDIKMRTLGFHRNAMKHAKLLNQEDRNFLQRYVDGVNTFINTLAGIKPGLWTIEDSLTIMYFMGWGSSANFQDEIISQMLIEKIGLEKAKKIFPLNINPDDPYASDDEIANTAEKPAKLGLFANNEILSYLFEIPLHIVSNNWTVGPKSSPNG
ncbi:MAG: penicillin acylase family protein, partial [Deltaproteobacteria bacterium]|nr:penicillin acylase family protein [Deltaproteobacteria bacterium]